MTTPKDQDKDAPAHAARTHPQPSNALLGKAWEHATTTGYPVFVIADPDLHAPYLSDEPFTTKDGEHVIAYVTADGTITTPQATVHKPKPAAPQHKPADHTFHLDVRIDGRAIPVTIIGDTTMSDELRDLLRQLAEAAYRQFVQENTHHDR